MTMRTSTRTSGMQLSTCARTRLRNNDDHKTAHGMVCMYNTVRMRVIVQLLCDHAYLWHTKNNDIMSFNTNFKSDWSRPIFGRWYESMYGWSPDPLFPSRLRGVARETRLVAWLSCCGINMAVHL